MTSTHRPAENGCVPAPDDLAGWKAADQRVFDQFLRHLREDDRLRGSRPVKRYFVEDDLGYFLEANADAGVAAAYASWGVLDYRSTRKSRTHAEKLLASGLPEPDATLVRARIAAVPTLYRVAVHDPGHGTVTLEDVLRGGSVTVHDRLMSENIDDGIFICARAFAAGRFRFLELAGPPLGAGMGSDAVAFLQRCGMEFTAEGQRRDAHLFGWLWQWLDERQAALQHPKVRNMDGHELLMHTASFSVADEAPVRRVLLSRPDIEIDKEANEFVWSRQIREDEQVMGQTVTLGRMEFVGDELILTVNSAERFASARGWIEKLPGVTFTDVTRRGMEEMLKDRPADERIAPPQPVEMTPQLSAAMGEMIHKHYMKWLDTPLPMLGGHSPRQMCRTDDGRRQVAAIIRTIQAPLGPAAIPVPREQMLRELGLAAEDDRETPETLVGPSDGPSRQAAQPQKVGRNAPCPCGSGRKYKKCCGRTAR